MLVLLQDARRLREILGGGGYTLKELWSENRWAQDEEGVVTATAFVLGDAGGREIDVHALRLDDAGNGIPAWNYAGDFYIPKQDFTSEGWIAGCPVHCFSFRLQKLGHEGYPMPEYQIMDMERLCRKYGAEINPGPKLEH